MTNNPVTRSELLELLAEQEKDRSPNMGFGQIMPLLDGLMKVLFPIIAYFGMHMFEKIDSFSSSMTSFDTKQEYMTLQINELKGKVDNFTSIPRFTQENFESEIKPLKQTVESNSITLKARNDWMDRTDDRLSRLEAEVSLIEGARK